MKLLYWVKAKTDSRHTASMGGQTTGNTADARHLDGFGTMVDGSVPPLPKGGVRVAQGHGVTVVDAIGRTRTIRYFD